MLNQQEMLDKFACISDSDSDSDDTIKYVPNDITMEFMVWRKLYLPEHENKTPVTHYKMIDYYVDVEEGGIGMIQCHRGLGKTQLGMEFSLFCICEGYEKYILFVGGTQDLSNDIVGSASLLAAEISNITVIRSVEGILEIVNVNGEPAYMVAKSTGSKLRGIAKGRVRQRPTAIVLDDIVDDQLVLNPLRMYRANAWLTSALMPTLVPGGKMFGSGTPLHNADPFMTICEAYGSFKIPLSETSFPDRFTKKHIERERDKAIKLGGLRSFLREYELRLTDDKSRLFDMKKVRFVDEMPTDVVCFLSCDLAFSEKTGADYSALIVNGVDKDGNWYIYPTRGRWKPSETAGKILALINRFNILDVGIEQGASMIAVKEHLDKLQLDNQNYFNIIELKHGGKSKISRISALEPVVESGRFHIVDNGDDAEGLVEEMEMTDSITVASKHDDLIDACAYMVDMKLYYSDGHREPTRQEILDDIHLGMEDDYDEDSCMYGGYALN